MQRILTILILLFLNLTSICQQQDYLFILDASGSMWQKLNREYKINTARRVLMDIVSKLPKEDRVGLIAYGHTKGNSCEDIQTLIPISSLDTLLFSNLLSKINPVGLTPIARSLESAMDIALLSSKPISIILISDGLETCGGNGCDIIKKAKEEGISFVTHVIGFGISDEDVSSLECIAQAGEGRYYNANSMEELAYSLSESVDAKVIPGGIVAVKVTREGILEDGMISIFPMNSNKPELSGRTYVSEETNPRVLHVNPGLYRMEISAVKLDGQPVQIIDSVLITGADTSHFSIDFSIGNLEISITNNMEVTDAIIQIFKSGTQRLITQSRTSKHANPPPFPLPPGNYDIEAKSIEIEGGQSHWFNNVTVKSGSPTNLTHDFRSGEIHVSTKFQGSLLDVVVQVIKEPTKIALSVGRTHASESSNPRTFIVPPGIYTVKMTPVSTKGLASKELRIRVDQGRTVEVTQEW